MEPQVLFSEIVKYHFYLTWGGVMRVNSYHAPAFVGTEILLWIYDY